MEPPAFETIALPTPYPVGRVNVYLLPGAPPVLVDTGVRSSRSVRALEEALAARGFALEDLGAILVTHPHFDHAGAALELARRSGAPVRCHRDAARDDAPGRRGFLELAGRFGAPASLLAELEGAWSHGDRFGEHLHAAPEVRFLEDGELVEVGGSTLEAVHTPGHSPGHMAFLSRGREALLCGDLLLALITPNPLPHLDPEAPRGRRSTLRLYLDSLDRVEALGPLRGLPGHGAPLADTVESARRARRHIMRRSEVLFRLVGNRPGARVFELAEAAFGQTDGLGRALAFCEVLAHVDLLEDGGRLAVDPEDGSTAPVGTGGA